MCRCQAGFAGQRCEINVNDCARSPCANGATCIDQINNYTCTCAAGFSGRDCDQPLGSECDSRPCHNGGKCHAGVHGQSFVCQCPVNFMGSLCEIPVFSIPLQKRQQPPSPFPWVAVSLAFGLMAFVMLLCVLAIALRHVQRPSGRQHHDTETMNNLTESQRDNLIVESQLKLTNKKVDLDSDCIVEKTNYKDRNFALDWNLAAGLKPDLTQDLKCHKNHNHRREESLPLRNPCLGLLIPFVLNGIALLKQDCHINQGSMSSWKLQTALTVVAIAIPDDAPCHGGDPGRCSLSSRKFLYDAV
eukprot:g41735.t1